jgi:hypothetical protein
MVFLWPIADPAWLERRLKQAGYSSCLPGLLESFLVNWVKALTLSFNSPRP